MKTIRKWDKNEAIDKVQAVLLFMAKFEMFDHRGNYSAARDYVWGLSIFDCYWGDLEFLGKK